MKKPLLEVSDLRVTFDTLRGKLTAVDGISFSLQPGETLGIVGESGCGKSLTSLALMHLLPPNATMTTSVFRFEDTDLQKISPKRYQDLRGGSISMIFQDPMTSLNPCFTVGYQLKEVLRVHGKASRTQSQQLALDLLNRVGIPDGYSRMESYPHQLSGGMCQRVMIAMAIALRPQLLIADEPTTALDVTIQAQILDLLRELQDSYGMAMILISHNLGVVAQMASRIAVMYAGQIVEMGDTRDVIQNPRHPYTAALLECTPDVDDKMAKTVLPSIKGMVPDLLRRPTGCQFHPRCRNAEDKCSASDATITTSENHSVKCFFPLGARHE